MRRFVLRVCALVALAGQLQWMPALALCHASERQASMPCEEPMPAGAAVAPGADLATGSCALMLGCTTRLSPAVTAAAVDLAGAQVAGDTGPGRAAQPPSFIATPLPPPPQG